MFKVEVGRRLIWSLNLMYIPKLCYMMNGKNTVHELQFPGPVRQICNPVSNKTKLMFIINLPNLNCNNASNSV